MATVLIKNAHVVTAVDNYIADILIEDGRVHTIEMAPENRTGR